MTTDDLGERAPLSEALREALDTAMLTHTGRSIGDLASERVIAEIMPLIRAEVDHLRAALADMTADRDDMAEGLMVQTEATRREKARAEAAETALAAREEIVRAVAGSQLFLSSIDPDRGALLLPDGVLNHLVREQARALLASVEAGDGGKEQG